MPPPPSARWWLETTEIAETNLGIWVSHDVKYTNKNYCFKQKTPAVRKKEQKMSLFVSLHTFVEKPVRFSLKLLKSLICCDNDVLSVSAPSSGCMVSTWALSTSSQSQSENREGSWEMTTFILRSVGYMYVEKLTSWAHISYIFRSFWTTHYQAFQERHTGIASDITFVVFNFSLHFVTTAIISNLNNDSEL